MAYLIDTNIISELRKIKSNRCHQGLLTWYQTILDQNKKVYISLITIGELYAGVYQCRRRNDHKQAARLEKWVLGLESEYQNALLPISLDVIKVWGTILWPREQHPIDKLIAATAMLYKLTLVTRNEKDFVSLNIKIINPFL